MKKLLAGIMLTSLLAFAACGDDAGEDDTNDDADVDATEEETE